MLVDWRKWGLGGSIEFRDPFYIRLWLGPLRWRVDDRPPPSEVRS